MKKSVLIAGMLLMFLMAGNRSLDAQRGMGRGINSRNGFGMRDMGRGQRPQYGMNQRDRFGMQDMGRGMGTRPNGPGRNSIESIPGLTDKQKTEIAALRKQQQDEMKKFRDEFSGKMQTIREEHRKKLMGLLTDEQKKPLEATGNRNQLTPKTK